MSLSLITREVDIVSRLTQETATLKDHNLFKTMAIYHQTATTAEQISVEKSTAAQSANIFIANTLSGKWVIASNALFSDEKLRMLRLLFNGQVNCAVHLTQRLYPEHSCEAPLQLPWRRH
ncbi:hypothetical protein DPMN_162649 [Dreissena polymorpha]|uniref:Uncharacterized protein n=1 Tax=Dreissena polymorpha TaxID=45954 RepID=A0A9D4IS69_DREPO|nr:hypothetical protein DPMN_162649 [Dreissena polymorpha]